MKRFLFGKREKIKLNSFKAFSSKKKLPILPLTIQNIQKYFFVEVPRLEQKNLNIYLECYEQSIEA
jgi:hypothetical protein